MTGMGKDGALGLKAMCGGFSAATGGHSEEMRGIGTGYGGRQAARKIRAGASESQNAWGYLKIGAVTFYIRFLVCHNKLCYTLLRADFSQFLWERTT